jgi:hypothetical protein
MVNVLEAMIGSPAQQGSSRSKNQKSLIDDIVNQIKSMQSQGQGDITQNQGYQTGQDWLMSMFNDPEFFKNFEAPMQRQFEEETIPGLANRFASMGSGGSTGSTAFRNQLAREGSNLHTNIAAMRGQMQQQAIPQMLQYAQQPASNMMNMYNAALTPVNDQYRPASGGLFGPAIGAFAGGVGGGAGQAMGGRFAGQSPLTY